MEITKAEMGLSYHRFSVIVCAYTEKRWDDLQEAVASLCDQTMPAHEIILSIDHNPALFDRAKATFADLTVIENSEIRGLSGARNSGIAAASGEIIAFMDEDAVASPDWIQMLNQGFSSPDVMGVGGAILPLWMSSQPPWFPEEFNWVVGCTYRGMPEITSPVRNLIGCNMAFRAEIFKQVGGFRSEIGRIGTYPAGCEETELCIRARQFQTGGKFIYEPRAYVSHRVPETRTTWKYFTQRCYAEGLSKALVSRMVGARDGLASERSYTFKTLPRGVLNNLSNAFFNQKWAELGRAAAISTGLVFTTAGYIMGRIDLMRNKGKTTPSANLSLDQA